MEGEKMLLDTIICAGAALVISAVFCKLGIPVLHKMHFGQYIREEGPQGHQKKSGTPTMGGIMFILAIVIVSAFFMKKYPLIIPVVVFLVLFGAIGFTDDYLKKIKKRNEGLKSWQKLGLQLIITGVFAFYLYRHPEIGTSVYIPFCGDRLWNLGWLFFPFVFVVVLGTDNGVNFTDGLDGLCASVTIVVSIFFAAFAMKKNLLIAPVAGAVAGALGGFLIFNKYPAKVFMGDTGSLALGGFVASYALMTRSALYILIVGFIYLLEVVSVILQVGYFKATHGKRIFRMAPIHHHFELGGWSEVKVVAVFTGITVVLSVIAFIFA